MSYVHGDVRAALRNKLALLPVLPVFEGFVQVAIEGFVFNRTDGQLYLQENFLPSFSGLDSLGSQKRVRHIGLYQITVCAPSDKGVAELDDMAGALLVHFPPGLELTYGSQKTTVARTYRSNSYEDAGWLRGPVTVEWFADTINPI